MKKFRPVMAIVMAMLMVCLLCGTAFAAEGDADSEDIVDVEEVVEEETVETEEVAEPEAAPSGRSVNKGALTNIYWALGFIALGVILIIVANNKSGKKKKPQK